MLGVSSENFLLYLQQVAHPPIQGKSKKNNSSSNNNTGKNNANKRKHASISRSGNLKTNHHDEDDESGPPKWTGLHFSADALTYMQQAFKTKQPNQAFRFDSTKENRLNQLHKVFDSNVSEPTLKSALLQKQNLWSEWIELQSTTLANLHDKIRGAIKNKQEGRTIASESDAEDEENSNPQHSLSDGQMRSLLRDSSTEYRSDFIKQLIKWASQLTQVNELIAWLSMLAQTAQISISECVKMYGVRCKADTLLSSFKLSKLHVLLLERCIMAQLMCDYPAAAADAGLTVPTTSSTIPAGSHILIGNGLPFSRQPKIQRQCHDEILKLESDFMSINSSEMKRLTSRVTNWFDRAQCTWTDD